MLNTAPKITQLPATIIIDEDEFEEVNPKLVKVLKKLLQPKLKLHNDDYLNLLLTHLTKSEDTDSSISQEPKTLINKLLLVWLKDAVLQFERDHEPPNPSILAFTLNVARYISKCEQTFVVLNSEDIFERLLTILKRVLRPNVIVVLIKLLSDLMDHKSGLQWIVSTNHWQLLLDLILNSETVYVAREGNKFVYKLLQKSICLNPTFCENVIQHILMPLGDTMKSMSENKTFYYDTKCLTSSLRTLNEVLVTLLQQSGKENPIILLFFEKYCLEKQIRALIKLTQDPELKGDLMKILIIVSIYPIKLKFEGQRAILVEKTDSYTNKYFNIIFEAMEISVSCVLQLLHVSLKTWSGIKATMPVCMRVDKKILTFENQILALQFTPVIAVFVKIVGIKVYASGDLEYQDEFRYQFVSQCSDKVYPKTIRVHYKWLHLLVENFSFNDAISSLKFFLHSKQLYKKEHGIMAFQMLVYFLNDLICLLKDNPQSQTYFLQEPDYLALHLKVMDVIIDEYDVTWQDSIEAMGVLNLTYNLLNGHIWPSKIVVNALKLAERAISKYMTYQMALLIDDNDNTVISEFPALLGVKLFDGAWEVRDSTIELIRQFAISVNTTKFSSYKRLMLESDFPGAMVRMATSDGNSFIRASALKCLQEIIKVQEFWDSLIVNCNIYKSTLDILQMETEGIVRSEAATLVGCIYEHQKICDESMHKFYNAMCHAVIADLHWEVRVNALKFWKIVIDDHLTQQGMIDGSFPHVTFSKQLRKIVTLSPAEVRKRLVVVLQELSQIGCLSVFYEALQDESDLEVSKYAAQAVSDFVGFIKQYEVSVQSLQAQVKIGAVNRNSSDMDLGIPHNCPLSDTSTDDEVSSNSSSQVPFSDSLMDQILDTRDLDLLESVFNSLDTPVMENIEIKKHSILSPDKFLDLVYSDFEGQISEKTKFVQRIDNFQSLLDDILKEYEPSDVNSMDCY